MDTPISKLPKPDYSPPKQIKAISPVETPKTYKHLDSILSKDFKSKYFNKK